MYASEARFVTVVLSNLAGRIVSERFIVGRFCARLIVTGGPFFGFVFLAITFYQRCRLFLYVKLFSPYSIVKVLLTLWFPAFWAGYLPITGLYY